MEKLIETHVTKPEISYTDKATNQNLRAITLEDELFLDSNMVECSLDSVELISLSKILNVLFI
jgi:hypothetical protein